MAEPPNTSLPASTPGPPSMTDLISEALKDIRAKGEPKKRVLHLGDAIPFNKKLYDEFSETFEIIRPEKAERQHEEFKAALWSGKWGDFHAIFRPSWGSGLEMKKFKADLIELLPASCEVFATAGSGVEWADEKAFGEKGIKLCNSGSAAADAVADFAVAMVISTFRHLPWCMGAAMSTAVVEPTDPEKRSPFNFCHYEATNHSYIIRGKVLGILGLGEIGERVAMRLVGDAFGMRLHYHNRRRKPIELEKALGVEKYHETLDSLLAESDCLVLCAPPRGDGKHTLDSAALGKLKNGARIVNVSRGSVIHEGDLVNALKSGRVSAAALDVHADEPNANPVNPVLRAMAAMNPVDPIFQAAVAGRKFPGKVMLSCHNAGGTVETHINFEEFSMHNIAVVLGEKGNGTAVNMEYYQPKKKEENKSPAV